MSIKHWPPHERPREKLFVRGAQYLSDAELIALFLKQGAKGRNAVEVARAALSGAGGLRAFLELDVPGMHGISGFGPASIAALKACLELGSRYLEARARRGDALRNPGDTRSFVRARLCGYPYEVFACLLLDNRHRIIRYEELFRGTIDGASVPPREVVRYALQHNAAAVIFAHNHPSGVSEPSHADRQLTGRLRRALALLDIRVLDHLVVGDGEVTSFAERGLL